MRAHADLHRIPPEMPSQIDLHLEVRDPEVVAALASVPMGRTRDEMALQALRIGVLALAQARGRIDADAVRNEGTLLLQELGSRLEAHQKTVTEGVAQYLREYFDPQSGRFPERLERLVKEDGELERLLRRQIGADDSALASTLTTHFGADSPLMKALGPDASSGVLASLRLSLEEALGRQRETILKEFSLDNREGALRRLVHELSERHGKLEEGIQGSVDRVVSEFSLDREDSALSRLVGRVERAQHQISREFTLDEETSALARLRTELLGVLTEHQKESASFREEIKTALASMQARREESLRSTRHGGDFEVAVYAFLQARCGAAGDVAEHTGNGTGRIKNSKVGDAVIELGPESAAPGARIVMEAKEKGEYDLTKARAEIEVGRKNRAAEVGLFVFSRRTAPAGLSPMARYGSDVFVVWDAEDETTDVYLDSGLSVAKAISTRRALDREAQEVDFEALDRAVRAVEKQCQGLQEIRTLTQTIRNNSDKVIKRADLMEREIVRQVESLDERLRDLREHGS